MIKLEERFFFLYVCIYFGFIIFARYNDLVCKRYEIDFSINVMEEYQNVNFIRQILKRFCVLYLI